MPLPFTPNPYVVLYRAPEYEILLLFQGGKAEWFASKFRASMIGVNIGVPVPREPFSFGGMYGTLSKYGDCDITGACPVL